MGICLITGVSSEAHVTSADAGALNAGIVGTGRYVLPIGRQFEYELISNNSIRIKDGYALNQGRLIGIRLDDYEDLNIENGISGTKRNDIVVIRYEMDINTGFETAMLDIIKGISGDVGVDPVMENGDILNGEIYDVMPLYRICFEGLNILKIEPIFQKISTLCDGSKWVKDNIINNFNVKTIDDAVAYRQVGKRIELKGSFNTSDSHGTISIPLEVCPAHPITITKAKTYTNQDAVNADIYYKAIRMVQIKINEDGTIYVGVEWSGDSRAIIGRALEIDLSGISYLLD